MKPSPTWVYVDEQGKTYTEAYLVMQKVIADTLRQERDDIINNLLFWSEINPSGEAKHTITTVIDFIRRRGPDGTPSL